MSCDMCPSSSEYPGLARRQGPRWLNSTILETNTRCRSHVLILTLRVKLDGTLKPETSGLDKNNRRARG
jgi:hypothetical protein